MTPLPELLRRRKALLARSARQRAALARELAPVVRAAGMMDRAAAGARWARARPGLLAGAGAAATLGAALMLASRPLRLVRLVRFGVTAWQTWRWARIVLGPWRDSFRNSRAET